ncbi:MAG TPA: hypothetical protein VMQ81_06620, partial [Acidimicrobiia bacterium]|nr:hypothetical protein [Acidimicrobiia bacterium]
VKLDLADALVAAGGFARARQVFREVAAEAVRDGDARSLGRAALGFSGGMGGIEVLIGDPEVCELLTAASEALDVDDVLGARVQARLSIALSYTAPLTERTRIASGARDRALAGGDPVAEAEALAAWCDVVAGPDHVEDRRAAATAVIERSRAVRDARLEALGQRLLIEALFEAGDLVAAEAEIARYERTAARLGRPEYGWYPVLWRGSLALARGQMDARARLAAQLDTLVGDASGTNAKLLAKVQRGSMAFDLADPDLAREFRVDIEAMGETVEEGQMTITRTLLGVIGGDIDRARANLDRCADTALDADRDSEWPGMMMQLAEVIVAVGGHAAAPRVLEALAPYGSVWAIEGIGAGIRGPLHRVAGSLAALAGDTEAAESHFLAAHQAATSAGAHLAAALVDHDAGRALGDRSRLERAADAWRSFGASHRLAQIEALIDGPRTRPGAGARSGNRFVREGDVWSITFDGETCTLADRKGLGDLARLIAEPGREIASLDLASPGGTVVQHDLGEVIDAAARDAYRKRLAEIDGELDEADEHADAAGSGRLIAERDALIEQLTGAYGLGRRTRRTGTTAERARTAVRSRIRDAMRRIDAANPALGRHLARSIRTGTFCVYRPDQPVDWELGDPSHTV